MTLLFTYEKEENLELEEDIYAKSKLNSKGYDNASSLVESDKIDRDSDWSFTSEDGNALLGEDGD